MRAVERFIEHIRTETKKNGVKLKLSPSKFLIIDHGTRVNGYFDDENNVIACSCGKSELLWLPILVHEYSHFEQRKDDCPQWRNSEYKGRDSTEVIDMWLSGKRIPKRIVKMCIARTRNLELDCERRTVKNIAKFSLPLSTLNYCRRGNAYVHFHNFVGENRKWYKVGHEPYAVPEVLAAMKTHLNDRYDRTPKKFMKLFAEHCV